MSQVEETVEKKSAPHWEHQIRMNKLAKETKEFADFIEWLLPKSPQREKLLYALSSLEKQGNKAIVETVKIAPPSEMLKAD